MDIENKNVDHSSSDITMESPVARGKQSLSPRKRAFRDCSDESNHQVAALDDDNGQAKKRLKIQRSQEEYPAAFPAHVAWKLDTGCDGGAFLVEKNQLIFGTSDGRVIFCDLEGHVTKQVPLSRPIGALLRHNNRLYAWCHAKKGYEKWKGALVDLSFDSPMVLFDVENFGDHCIHADMVDGCLALADNNGNMALFGCDGRAIWTKEHLMLGDGGFLMADESGVYMAHQKVVRCYSLATGDVTWEFRCPGGRHANMSKGYQSEGSIYIESNGKVMVLSKSDGTLLREYAPYRHSAAGVCVGSDILVTGNNPTVVFSKSSGDELYRMCFPARLDQAISQLPENRQLYMFWDQIYCINLTDQGMKTASEGKYARTFTRKVPKETDELPEPRVGTLTKVHPTDEVIVTCSDSTEDNVKVTVESDGYEDWPVMFPRDLRVPGRKFVVDNVKPSKLGQFYWMTGKIIAKYIPDNPTKEVAEEKDSLKADKDAVKEDIYTSTLEVPAKNKTRTILVDVSEML